MVNLNVGDERPEGAADTVLQDVQRRLAALESEERKSFFKTVTTSASTAALLLGLVITLTQVYDVVFLKPEADRIARISQFNQAVGSAAKVRYELAQVQAQVADPGQRLMLASYATPRILNEIATAKAMLAELSEDDVGIPQLIVLISESFTENDLASAKIFVERAVAKRNVTDYLQSEARRYQGKYHLANGNVAEARKSFEAAVAVLGTGPKAAASRAYTLSDAAASELAYGECQVGLEKLGAAIQAIHVPDVLPNNRGEMKSTLLGNLMQWSKCAIPPEMIERLRSL